MIQVVKYGAEAWTVTRVDAIWKNAHEYTLLGRVVRDGLHYYAEIAEWAEETHTYRRLPRGFLLAKPAFKQLVAEASKEKVLA